MSPRRSRPSVVRRLFRWLADAIRFAGPTIAMSSQVRGQQSRTENLIDSAMWINAGRDIGREAARAEGEPTDQRDSR